MTHRSLFAISFALAFCLCACSRSATSDGGPAPPDGIWTGAIVAQGTTLRLEVHIKSGATGGLTAEMVSIDQGNARMSVDSISIQDGAMTFSVVQIAGSFSGLLNQQGNVVIGTWSQLGNELPLTFKKQD